jgi:hypothetical protein
MKEAVALVLVAITLPGCQKIMDFYKPDHNHEVASCRISGYSYDYYGDHFSTAISYDTKNNPVKITYYSIYYPGGSVIETLKYDNQNRLMLDSPDFSVGNIRKYVYEGSSKTPLRDTMTDSFGNIYLESFEADAGGRITRVQIEHIYRVEDESDWEFKTEVYNYYYDIRGNRQENPFDHPWNKTIRYSDRPSLYSLHPAWKIISRDYSRNSIPNAKRYTDKGLPVDFIFNEFGYWQPFLDLNIYSVLAYDCEER